VRGRFLGSRRTNPSVLICDLERGSSATSTTDLQAHPNGDSGEPALRPVQELFREVNDQIRTLVLGWDGQGERDFVCECADPRCVERLAVSASDYDRVRSNPTRFLLKPGHASGQQRVIEETEALIVVETVGAKAPA
jgi:hypothetical protein